METAEAFAARAAREITDRLRAALAVRERVALALAGGETPRAAHLCLARLPDGLEAEDWERIEFFWGDERLVEAGDSGSNVEAARRDFLDPLAIPERQIHAPRKGIEPDRTARDYEAVVRSVLSGGIGDVPRFDLVVLGVGADGHTASLFPGAALHSGRLVVPARSSSSPRDRITFSFELIAAAREVLFLVAGEAKAAIVQRLLAEADPTLPATLVRPTSGRLSWLLDEGAARRLSSR